MTFMYESYPYLHRYKDRNGAEVTFMYKSYPYLHRYKDLNGAEVTFMYKSYPYLHRYKDLKCHMLDNVKLPKIGQYSMYMYVRSSYTVLAYLKHIHYFSNIMVIPPTT
jgi:hypothetical protein